MFLGMKLISEIPSKSSTVKPLFVTHLAQYHLGRQYDKTYCSALYLHYAFLIFNLKLYFVL